MASDNESISELIRGTIRDGIGLVRDEIFLARTELREEVVRVKSALITVVAAIVARRARRDDDPRHDRVGRCLRI